MGFLFKEGCCAPANGTDYQVCECSSSSMADKKALKWMEAVLWESLPGQGGAGERAAWVWVRVLLPALRAEGVTSAYCPSKDRSFCLSFHPSLKGLWDDCWPASGTCSLKTSSVVHELKENGCTWTKCVVTASVFSSGILTGPSWKQVSDKACALLLTASLFTERRMGMVAYLKTGGLERSFSQCACELYQIPAAGTWQLATRSLSAKAATNQLTKKEKWQHTSSNIPNSKHKWGEQVTGPPQRVFIKSSNCSKC